MRDVATVSKEPLTFSWKKLTITQAIETTGAACTEPRNQRSIILQQPLDVIEFLLRAEDVAEAAA